jgi:hypothetical protein
VFRIHSDSFLSLALAAASIAFRSSTVKRTGTILPLASPFGSLGREMRHLEIGPPHVGHSSL